MSSNTMTASYSAWHYQDRFLFQNHSFTFWEWLRNGGARDKGWPANTSTFHEFSSTENVSSTGAGMVLLTAITLMSRMIAWTTVHITVCSWIYLRSHISFYKKIQIQTLCILERKVPKRSAANSLGLDMHSISP